MSVAIQGRAALACDSQQICCVQAYHARRGLVKVWKSGVILKKDDTLAEIIEYYGKREIRIRINGKSKRDLLAIIAHEMAENLRHEPGVDVAHGFAEIGYLAHFPQPGGRRRPTGQASDLGQLGNAPEDL